MSSEHQPVMNNQKTDPQEFVDLNRSPLSGYQ